MRREIDRWCTAGHCQNLNYIGWSSNDKTNEDDNFQRLEPPFFIASHRFLQTPSQALEFWLARLFVFCGQ